MEEQKKSNAQLSQKIHTVENSFNKKVDGLQNGIDHKFDNLQKSISRLSQQHVHLEEENPEGECLGDTIVEEQCLQQLQEGLLGNYESSYIGGVVCPWEKKEETSPMLTGESSGKDSVEELQKHNLHLPSLDPDPVYILPATQPTPTAQSTPKIPAAKAKASPSLPMLENFKKLVATVQTFATTSKTFGAAQTAWHSGWFVLV